MKSLLVIHSSLNHPRSASRSVAKELIDGLKLKHPGLKVQERDLFVEPLPHFSGAQVEAAFTPSNERTVEQQVALTLSDKLCEELLSCDSLLISAPMWNFSIPSVLKAWIDHIVRAGMTFQYGPTGPSGLAKNLERVFLVESAGGIYQDQASHLNHVAPYLENVMHFLGAQSVQRISAQGTAVNPDAARKRGQDQVRSVLASLD